MLNMLQRSCGNFYRRLDISKHAYFCVCCKPYSQNYISSRHVVTHYKRREEGMKFGNSNPHAPILSKNSNAL